MAVWRCGGVVVWRCVGVAVQVLQVARPTAETNIAQRHAEQCSPMAGSRTQECYLRSTMIEECYVCEPVAPPCHSMVTEAP